ncbi:Bax inhibitor-1 family protein [Ureibacillus manganicus]|nr:Bax inhibitor-1 family protein [Ureibacillus manganicus]
MILQHYAVMWGLMLFGVLFGTWLPSSVVTPISLICLALIVVTCFVKHIRLPDIILYLVPFLTGIMLLWLYLFFIDILGEDLLFTVFVSTVIIFTLLAVAGMKIPGDITEMGSIIFAVVVVVIVFSFVFVFFPVENTFLLFLAAMLVLFFAVYTVFEFNMICYNYVRDDDVIYVTLYLFLSFFNLIANLLEVVRRN